jgi:hypothetical protein
VGIVPFLNSKRGKKNSAEMEEKVSPKEVWEWG